MRNLSRTHCLDQMKRRRQGPSHKKKHSQQHNVNLQSKTGFPSLHAWGQRSSVGHSSFRRAGAGSAWRSHEGDREGGELLSALHKSHLINVSDNSAFDLLKKKVCANVYEEADNHHLWRYLGFNSAAFRTTCCRVLLSTWPQSRQWHSSMEKAKDWRWVCCFATSYFTLENECTLHTCKTISKWIAQTDWPLIALNRKHFLMAVPTCMLFCRGQALLDVLRLFCCCYITPAHLIEQESEVNWAVNVLI